MRRRLVRVSSVVAIDVIQYYERGEKRTKSQHPGHVRGLPRLQGDGAEEASEKALRAAER